MWRNCTVWLVGLTVSLVATGCHIREDNDTTYVGGSRPPGPGPVVAGQSGLRVRWDLASLDNRFTSCDAAGTDTVVMTATRSNGLRFEASFPCDAAAGMLTGLPPGTYSLALDLISLSGRPVSAVDHPGVVVFDGLVSEPEPAVFAVQSWDLLWTIGIERLSGGVVAATCRDVGATTARFTSRMAGEAPETVDLPCEDYGAVSPAIQTGDYEVRLMLLDARGRVLGDTGLGLFAVTFDAPAELDADFVF